MLPTNEDDGDAPAADDRDSEDDIDGPAEDALVDPSEDTDFLGDFPDDTEASLRFSLFAANCLTSNLIPLLGAGTRTRATADNITGAAPAASIREPFEEAVFAPKSSFAP